MSAVEIQYPSARTAPENRFHIVVDGEVSGAARRAAHARTVARARSWARVKTYAAFTSAVALFGSAFATLAWAFVSVPNTPLP